MSSRRLLGSAMLAVALSGGLFAAPKLRLATAAVGPVSMSVGANGLPQTIEAYNAGDGTLNLKVSSSVAWAQPTVGASRNCISRSGACLPIQIAFQTASLAKGIYTGTLTVSDPAAIDAPQLVTVTVQMGGGVPDRVDLFAPPDGSFADRTFSTNSALSSVVTTASGGLWLSVALDGGGSFQFVRPYRIRARFLDGMQEGAYSGSIAFGNSALAAENKAVPVVLNITSRPILAVSPESIQFRLAQGVKKQTQYVAFRNRGMGALSVTGATASNISGESWLSALRVPGADLAGVTADPGTLAAGRYRASVAIASNAASGTVTVPVDLEVVAAGPPVASYRGLVSNATFAAGDPLAQGDIVALFGEQLTLFDPVQAAKLPLADQLGGARVLINDRAVPLYYASYGQLNLQIPFDTPAGEALVGVEREGQRGNTISIEIANRVPRILRLGIGDYGIIVNQDGSFPIPATPGVFSHPAAPGDALVIYALGLGVTTPVVASGAGAPGEEPLARVEPPPQVYFGGGIFAGGLAADPFFVGLTPAFVGLYQINVFVPQDVTRGPAVPIYLDGGGTRSNRVTIAVE